MVEHNMRLRRGMIQTILNPNEYMCTLTAFPLMGVNHFTEPNYPIHGSIADSDYIPDQMIGAHPRFATLTQNIRSRRGRRIDIRVPLFQDKNTVEHIKPLIEQRKQQDSQRIEIEQKNGIHREPRPDVDETKEIHMDAMGFGNKK
jgi:glutamate--cysteine ligase catalytic subunit